MSGASIGPESPKQDDTSSTLEWGPTIDILLARWCDEAKAHEWMHTEAASTFGNRAHQMMIALNVLTATAGLSNVVAGGSVWGGFQSSWLFGSLSIAVSILTMLQDKLNYTKYATEHRLWAQQWSLIRRRIEEELTIPLPMRKSCYIFLKTIRNSINHVSIAGAQQIPETIRDACKKRFENIPDFELPEICGVAEHTRVYVALPG
jgi:hypothetical protein